MLGFSSRWLLLFVAPLTFSNSASAAEKSANENWQTYCTKCHGADGKGQTRLGRKSGSPDLTDRARRLKLTDEDAFNGIKFGRKNAKGEEKMDAYGSDITDPEIRALVAYVRKFSN